MELAVRGNDAVAVVNAESARLLMALNDAAEATARGSAAISPVSSRRFWAASCAPPRLPRSSARAASGW